MLSTRSLALLSAIFGFAVAQSTCPYSTVTVTASLATASTSTVSLDTVYVTVQASPTTTTVSVCSYTQSPYVSTVVTEVLVTKQVTITDLTTVHGTVVDYTTVIDVVTKVTTQVDVVTIQSYYTAPACSLVPTIQNSNFSQALASWTPNAQAADTANGYGVSTSSQYTFSGPMSADFVLPINSNVNTNIANITQRIEICPGRPYEFSVYSTTGVSNVGTCFTRICLEPDANGGSKVCSADMRLWTPATAPGTAADWVQATVSFNNAIVTNTHLTVGINVMCAASSIDHVYIDSVTIKQSGT